MSLAEPIVSGMLFGLVLSAMVGPVFLALLHTSLQEGFKAGAHLAFGILLSDAACIAFSYFFATRLNLHDTNKELFGLAGGIILTGFGIYLATRRISTGAINQPARAIHARYTARGFVMNAANPAVLLLWLSVVGQVKLKENYVVTHEAVFFASSLLTVFGTDLLKSYAAHRIKKLLKPGLLKVISVSAGIILSGYGIWMIWKAVGGRLS